MTLPAKLVRRILKRDGFRCQYCGASPKHDEVVLHIDHIVPRNVGGGDSEDNLRTLCLDCNYAKAGEVPDDHERSLQGRRVKPPHPLRGRCIAIEATKDEGQHLGVELQGKILAVTESHVVVSVFETTFERLLPLDRLADPSVYLFRSHNDFAHWISERIVNRNGEGMRMKQYYMSRLGYPAAHEEDEEDA